MKNKPSKLPILSDAVMFDIETLGLRRNCVVLSVGMTLFNSDVMNGLSDLLMYNTYYWEVSPVSCLEAGLKIEPATLEWWGVQKKKALESDRQDYLKSFDLLKLCYEGEPLATVINEIEAILLPLNIDSFWANSPHFDLEILDGSSQALGRQNSPFSNFRKHMDYRTIVNRFFRKRKLAIKDLFNYVPDYITYHRADHDAAVQACILQRALNMGYEALEKMVESNNPSSLFEAIA